ADAVTFLPYDLPGPCRRAIAALRPDVLVLEYTELWPQLIRAASRAGVRLAMTNGRIAPENLGRYRLLFALAGNLLEQSDVLMMRAEDEAERALQLGAPRSRGGRRPRARVALAPALRARRRRSSGGARHHRRARPRLPARHPRVRGRQLHPARRAEHPRARGLRQAGAVRSPHGELPGQRAGAGGARRLAGARPGRAPAHPARPARAAGGDPHPGPARARRGVRGPRSERPRCAPDRRSDPRGGGVTGFWWRRDEPGWAELALWPLSFASLAYRAASVLARGSVRPVKAGAPVISVGNLVVGGAGKTPVAL